MNKRTGSNHGGKQKYQPISKEDVPKFQEEWITKGISYDCVNFTNVFGRYLCDLNEKYNKRWKKMEIVPDGDSLTRTQIRNYFNEVRRIQQLEKEKREIPFLLLKPKLAYAVAKAPRGSRIKDFKEIMDKVHDIVMDGKTTKKFNQTYFENFIDFFEAILAYHKSFGGKD